MTDRESLNAAILEDPSADTPRLVLADLLRESDDPDSQARGRFLWQGVTASKYRDREAIEDCLYYTAQDEIAAVASAGFPALWVADLRLGPRPVTRGDWGWDSAFDRVSVRVGEELGVFTRGMISEVTVTLDEWYDLADYALAHWPVEGDRHRRAGLIFTIDAVPHPVFGYRHWRLSTRLRRPARPRSRPPPSRCPWGAG